MKADFDKTDYLLRIVEISDENAYLADLFNMKECVVWDNIYVKSDIYVAKN